MRKLLTVFCAVCAVAVPLGAGTASAAPPTATKLVPETLKFGTVAVDGSAVKPVTILNRTNSTLSYESARWPNLEHPGLPFPYGIWNLSFEPFPCWEIAPKSSCTLEFQFVPAEAGPFASKFDMTYGDGVDSYTTNTISMRGTGK